MDAVIPPPGTASHEFQPQGRFFRLLDDANAPVVGLSLQGLVTIWNKKAVAITRIKARKVLGKPLQQFIQIIADSCDVPRNVQDLIDRVLKAPAKCLSEVSLPLKTAAGGYAHIMMNINADIDEYGRVVGLIGIGQDVTQLRLHEKQYASVMMQANAPIIELDDEGRISVWNAKAASLTGFAVEEAIGVPLLEMVDEHFRDIVAAAIKQTLATGEPGPDFELPLITSMGSHVEIVLCLTPQFAPNGSVVGIVAIGQDVTERNAKEMEYQTLIDSANAPIFGVDTEMRIVIFNKKAAEICEYVPEEVMGEDLVECLIAEDFKSKVATVFEKAFMGIERANFEFPMITKTGRKVEILLNATPRYDHLGNISGVVGIGQDITERIVHEQEYSRLIDTANAPIFGVDQDNHVTIWNKKAAAITEYELQDAVGQDLLNFISPESRDAVKKVLGEALIGVETANFEFPLVTKSGRKLYIILNATPKYDHIGAITGVVGIGQDFTDRRMQEQEYSRLIDTANAPIFGVDIDKCVNIWNRKAVQTTEYPVPEVVGVNLVEAFIPEDYKVRVDEVLSKALKGFETANFEFPLISKSGRRVEILLNATPRYDEKGDIIGVVGIGQDITVRITQEQEYSRLIDTANAPIFGVDRQGLVTIWNQKAAEIMQYSAEEVIGQDLVQQFISDGYRAAVGRVLSEALNGAQTSNFNFPLITRTGRRVEILLSATPQNNELGETVGVACIGQDITDRIAQEQEYARLIDTANAPIFGVDQAGRVNIWNKKAATVTQYTPSEVMGEDLVEKFITEDFKDAVRFVLSKALNGIETANFEFPLMTKAGRRVEILLNATPRFNELGEVIGMVGIGQDITDRIAQEQEYSRLIEKANAPIFGVDVHGCVNIWNRKFEQITQYSTEEALHENLVTTFISEAYRESVATVISKALKGDESANFEVPFITKAGRKLTILLNATARFDQLGEIVGVVCIGQDITDRIAQEQEYTRLIDTANAPIFGVDQNGLVNIWNKKAAETMQYTTADVMGENLVEKFITEDYRKAVKSVLSKALDGVETANFEFPLVTKAGRRVEILLNATCRYDERGKVIGMVGIGQDITDRIAQEQEYFRLIDTANAPIFGVDANLCVNIWNKKAAEITQYSSSYVMGKNLVEEFIREDFKDAVRFVLSKALGGAETANFEFPLMTKAGRRVEILLNATPRFNELGEVIGVVGIGQDITERIAQEQEYSRLIETANAPIFGVDIDGRVNVWNRKFEQITQYSKKEALHENLVTTFISEAYRGSVDTVISKALHGDESANFEVPFITKAGRKLTILLNATARFDQLGEIVGVVCIGQDITDRIAQEQEYSRLIDTANAPIFGVDQNGLVNIWNKKAAEITQYTTVDVMGENLVEKFITKDYRMAVKFVLSKALDGVETANFEFPLMTKAGRRVEILLNATCRYDERGKVIGMVGIGQDITDRIAQEQEYSRLIDTANAPIFGVNQNGLVNIWNKKAAEITQYSSSYVMGKNLVEEFITEGFKDAVRFVLSKALNGIETANFEFPLMTKAGRRVEILLNATPRFNELGEVIGMVGIGQDITDRIAQEQEYSRLIEKANAPIFGVDVHGCVNIWNRKFEQITQYSTEEALHENIVTTFISEAYRESVATVISKALKGDESANFEVPFITKAGRKLTILLNATARFDQLGEIVGVVCIGQDITDRIAQEQEYSRLIEKANAPIFGVDVNGCVNIWNRKTAEITQYSKSEVMGTHLVNTFIASEYRDGVHSVITRALKGDETSNFEFGLMTKTGRTVMVLLNGTARFDQHGQIVGVVGIGQDLSGRIAQEEEYTRLIDTANAPIFGVDANLCVNIWNKKAAQITQYSTAEVIGENLVETFISPEYRPIVAEVFSKALAGVQTANFEFPLITRPGTRIEILLNATPRMDLNGNIVGVVGIGQDITDRIAQEHEYFRLIDTANAPIFGVDTFGCINEWNQKIEEITGYHKQHVLGLSLVDAFINPESRHLVRRLLNQALIGMDVGEMELPMTTNNNRPLLLLVNASSKKDMHGNIRGVIGVGQDYTAKKHMEAARVTFLASFSHELRTPLNGVLGMLELLREQKLEKQCERFVHMAYVSGSLLLNLINDILDLSKIEAGHMEISTDPFQMQDLLDYSIDIFKFKAREKSVKLLLEVSPSVPKVVIGDVFRLRQVLLNLLSNAIKFTNKGSITVKCSTVPSPDLPKTFVKLLFQVIDTGVGMDNEGKSRLFSLFTKLERTRKNNPTGSGLGLAICKQLVELMNGQIDVESEEGEGSEFFFNVVVQRVESENDELTKSRAILAAEAGNAMTASSSNGAVTECVPKHARILVVEDNEFNWEVVKCFCTEDNHLLQWEVNGRDAYMAYKEHHDSYDLILMDCEMPIMNGYTATKKIREFEAEAKISRIPIIGLTAYAMSGDRKKCLDAGMDEFIVKPITKPNLRNAIREWMVVRYVGRNSWLSREPSAFSEDSDHSESAAAKLVPASTHSEALDLTRAISDLELEDPMMISHNGGGYQQIDPSVFLSLTTLSESKSVQSGSSDTMNNRTIEEHRALMEASDRPSIPTGDATSFSNGAQSSSGGTHSLYMDAVSEIPGQIPKHNASPSFTKMASASGLKASGGPDYEDKSKNDNQGTADEADASNVVSSSPCSFASSAQPEDIIIPDGDPIDYALGVDQCGGNENLFFSLLEKYASVCEEYMGRIEVAYSTKDYVVLRRESHSLKGSSAYVAAMRISKAAFRLQVATERVMEHDNPSANELASLKNSMDLLKKENRSVLGYLRRNFSFRRTTGHSSESRDGNNACVLM